MMRRKFDSVMRRAAAAHLNTILPSRHRHTRRVRRLTPLCGLSITLVEHKQRAKRGDSSRRFTVNISAKPSRKLAAALGYSCSSHCACFSSLAIPSFAGSRKPARMAAFTWSFNSSGKYPVTFSSLCWRHLCTENPVQRCRQHKLENVTGYLPEELKDQVKAAMRAGFRLPAKEGMAKLEKQAQWLEHEYPSAAASLREGLAEMFTVNRLELSPRLARCLCSTNVIESPHSGVRRRTRRVCRWRDGKMVLRWAAAALLMTESNFRRIMGYRDLWMLAAALGRKTASAQEKVA